jgi:guanylate kinase
MPADATSGRRGIPIVVAAPSGAGKTTVCRGLVAGDPRLVFSVSHTTRPRRPGETDGLDYHFVPHAEFERLAAAGAFLEWAEYSGNLYGTSWAAIEAPLAEGRDVLLEIEVQGARQVRQRLPEAVLVFLIPPSLRVLEERLRTRGTDGAEEIERRLAIARRELATLDLFDYAVVNEELSRAVAELREIVAAERAGRAGPLRERHAPKALSADLRRALGVG